jgi:hypothetical protein
MQVIYFKAFFIALGQASSMACCSVAYHDVESLA